MPVAYAGRIIEDPITKQQITFLKTARETCGELLRFEVCMAPGGFINKHMHPKQQERVEVVSGTLQFRIRGRDRSLSAGETLVVNPGEAHEVHNKSGANAVFVVEARPALRTERGLEIIFGLAKDGMTNQNGRPKNVLQRGLIAFDCMNEVALSGVPLVVQRAVVAPLAALDHLLGYRSRYSRYADDPESL
ncbi:MAG: cupin domain-containing protein [Actinomycetota bacterium]